MASLQAAQISDATVKPIGRLLATQIVGVVTLTSLVFAGSSLLGAETGLLPTPASLSASSMPVEDQRPNQVDPGTVRILMHAASTANAARQPLAGHVNGKGGAIGKTAHPVLIAQATASQGSTKVGTDSPPSYSVESLTSEVATMDYEEARYHPLHFPPAINSASDEQCLVCHKEILENKPLASSPAGVAANSVLAWYQTLDTYDGEQMSFHQRHISSPYAKKVMNLSCNFCHQGSDPREEHPDMMPAGSLASAETDPPFTLRKDINPSKTCLLCHGAMPDPKTIMNLTGPWPEVRKLFEPTGTGNGCMACHGAAFRTTRHQVKYLKAEAIEAAAQTSSDVCYGCHGGRSWYSISYPYPRNPWPAMDKSKTPEWAIGRPTHSDPRYALPETK